jgi:hypothetical protein
MPKAILWLKTPNAQRIRRLNELIERTNFDIRELDSLQKVKYFEETRSRMSETGQIVLLQEQQTQMFYRDIQYLMGKNRNTKWNWLYIPVLFP